MNRKQQITFGVIVGTCLLIALLIITLFIECPTQSQNTTFRIILALTGAAFSICLTGFITFRYKDLISAGGALAVFAIIFLLKPAQIDDFTNCKDRVFFFQGTLFIGNNVEPAVNINLLKQNQSTTTNESGNFGIQVDFSSLDESLSIRLRKDEINLDTLIFIKNSELSKSIDIRLRKKFCVTCSHFDATNKIIRQKTHCSFDSKFISNYIKGFTQSGDNQNLRTECMRD